MRARDAGLDYTGLSGFGIPQHTRIGSFFTWEIKIGIYEIRQI